jgi:2-polyprenyl-3-methyl-5-hydroxy-6-metoxy-1,4-benzoquinol methylase
MWFWDWIAKRYDKRARVDEDLIRSVERVGKYLSEDDTVLDYACGRGVVTIRIAADVKQVYGIDASGGMIVLAKGKARKCEIANVHFEQKTIFDEGIEKEAYDLILAFNIMHLSEDAQAALQRASELLMPGGLVISEMPCIGEAGIVLRTLLPRIGKILGIPFFRSFTISEVIDLMRDRGFQILETDIPERRIRTCFVVNWKR